MDVEQSPRGKYFEQFSVGDMLLTGTRTILEADINNFAALTGDHNLIHTDNDYAKASRFGRKIAHGLLIQSIASGLAVQTGFLDGTIIAFRSLSTKFSLPVFIGDTIHAKLEVIETKANRRISGGNLILKVSVINQEGKTVQRGKWGMLVASSKS